MVPTGLALPSLSAGAFLLLGTGMLGMGLGDLLGGDDGGEEGDGGDSSGDSSDDDFFEDDGMDEFDEMDGLDDGFDDGFEDGGDGNVGELETRVDDLEDELAGISSTVSTVRSENEEISETVDEIEENIRDLLDIYEMVTRGVNPFVDDVGPGGDAGGGGDGGAFGLFDDDGDEAEEDLDEEVASADAEEFFDDDLLDDGDDAFADDDGDDAFADDDGDDLLDGDDGDGGDDAGADAAESGGTTFSDLKEEYESGDADWADDVEIGDEEDAAAGEPAEAADVSGGGEAVDEADVSGDGEAVDEEPLGALDGEAVDPTDDLDGGADALGDLGTDESFPDDGTANDPTATADRSLDGGVDETPSPAATDPDDADGAESSAFEFGAVVGDEDDPTGDGTARPYLPAMPSGLSADATALAWLSFLLEHDGPAGAVAALRYYRRIDWIGPAAEEALVTFLGGLGDGADRPAASAARAEADGGAVGLDPGDHRRSLAYIARLGDVPADALCSTATAGGVPRSPSGGEDDGVQR